MLSLYCVCICLGNLSLSLQLVEGGRSGVNNRDIFKKRGETQGMSAGASGDASTFSDNGMNNLLIKRNKKKHYRKQRGANKRKGMRQESTSLQNYNSRPPPPPCPVHSLTRFADFAQNTSSSVSVSFSAQPLIAIILAATSRGASDKKLGLFTLLLPSLNRTLDCGLRYLVVVGYDQGDEYYDTSQVW